MPYTYVNNPYTGTFDVLNDGTLVTGAAGSSGQIQYNNAGAFGGTAAGIYAASGSLFTLVALVATDKPLIVKGASAQSANLQEWQKSDGSILLAITKDGYLYDGTSTRFITWPDPTLSSFSNLFIGHSSGTTGVTGYANTGIGRQALGAITSGLFNIAIGDLTMPAVLDGGYNVAVGAQALYATTNGSYNVALGYATLRANTSGQANMAIGANTMGLNTTGSNNVAIGGGVLPSNTTGNYNTALGSAALFHNTTADYNTAVSYNTLNLNTTGTQNTAVGVQALAANTTGGFNTGIGVNSGYANITGSYNTFIGYLAGFTGTSSGLSNASAFGYNAQVTQSNSIILGASAQIGVGVTAPSGDLHVKALSSSDIVAIVQGATSQTANLQEWQNSSANILAQVDKNGHIGTLAGTSTTLAKVGGSIVDHYADVSNGGTAETDLYADTLGASVLAANGDKVTSRYGGVFTGAVSATQQLRAYFGGTLIFDSGALAIGVASPNWDLSVSVIRESSTVVRCSAAFTSSSAALAADAQYTRITGLTLSNTQILKITGTAGGINGASNQITASLGFVEWRPAA